MSGSEPKLNADVSEFKPAFPSEPPLEPRELLVLCQKCWVSTTNLTTEICDACHDHTPEPLTPPPPEPPTTQSPQICDEPPIETPTKKPEVVGLGDVNESTVVGQATLEKDETVTNVRLVESHSFFVLDVLCPRRFTGFATGDRSIVTTT